MAKPKTKLQPLFLHMDALFKAQWDKAVNATERRNKETAFHRRARRAIRTTLEALLRPVRVRDVRITPLGDIERTPAAQAKHKRLPDAPWFDGAGNTPEYWYKKGRKAHESAKEK